MLSRSRLFMLGAFSALGWSLGCGARTGLPAPDAPTVDAGDVGSGGAGGLAAVACTDGPITLLEADPTLMFVLDRSGSMGDHLGKSNGQQSRWSILTDALSATLPPVDASMEIGALLYPGGFGQLGGMTCSVPLAPDLPPAKGNVAALLALMAQTPPGGATPTADAVYMAASALAGVRAATTARALVLATDGGPNCNTDLDSTVCRCVMVNQSCQGKPRMCLDDARTEERIAGFEKTGLPTYVIGIQDEGDDSLTDVLNAMADAGGRPRADPAQRYYAARSAAELDAALAAIRDQVGACTYLTTSVPDAQGTIVLSVNGVVVPFDEAGVEGWTWASTTNGEIALRGTACLAAAASATAKVAAVVKCGGA
jgi:hypothetical protein